MSSQNQNQETSAPVRFKAFGWLMQRITGVGLLLFLGLHFWLQHMPNGFLATAEEYNSILRELGSTGQEFADAFAKGALKEALPGEHVITYSKVLERLQAPLWKMIDIMLLFLALSHGMLGVSRALGDYVHNERIRKIAVAMGWTVSVLLAWQGTMAVMSVGMN